MSNLIIKAEKLYKIYNLQRQKTFKEFLPALFSGSKTRKKVNALSDINFDLFKGQSLGIMGKNGSGKSTLLKLIAGVTIPTMGDIKVFARVAPLIELGAGFHPELTGKENIFLNGSILGIKKRDMDKLYDSIIDFSELHNFIDEPIKFYSSGMYMRLAFSVAVAKTPDILLVDEILAVGDAKFQEKCLNRIKKFQKSGTTMIMVSHNIEQIREHCNQGLVLQNGKQKFFGSISEAIEKYQKIIT